MTAIRPHVGLTKDGRLATTCWCEAKVFYLPKERVGVETVSCGRDGCAPPATGAKRGVG